MNKQHIEQRLLENMKKNNGGHFPDERQRQLNAFALTVGLIFAVIFDLIMMIYYFTTKNIEKSYPYVAQLLIIAIGFFFASRATKEVSLPKTFFGKKEINPEKSLRAFGNRFAACAADAFILATIFTACDAYIDGTITVSLLSDGICSFVFLIIFNVAFCELQVRRYRKYMKHLDAEENNLDDEA